MVSYRISLNAARAKCDIVSGNLPARNAGVHALFVAPEGGANRMAHVS
jgi:hypothetical protein